MVPSPLREVLLLSRMATRTRSVGSLPQGFGDYLIFWLGPAFPPTHFFFSFTPFFPPPILFLFSLPFSVFIFPPSPPHLDRASALIPHPHPILPTASGTSNTGRCRTTTHLHDRPSPSAFVVPFWRNRAHRTGGGIGVSSLHQHLNQHL